VTDPFGKQVQYGYDTDRGLNTSVTQPNGQVIGHTFQNSSGLLTGTSATVTGLGTVTNGYTYGNNSRITEIQHNTAGADVVYGFVYNALGWLTGVSVGTNNLVTNNYEPESGRLNSIAYGNNQTVGYEYDEYDRVVGVKLGTTLKYSFDYDATGQVGYLDDKVQNKQYWYLSDLAGRLSEVRRSDGNSARYTYNASNQVTAFNETISGTNYSTTYSYDNDQRMVSLAAGLLSETVGYDTANNLDRVLTISRAYNGVNKITTTYGYQAGASGQSVTSKRIASITNGSKDPIVYTYDDNGNIATITQGTDVSDYFYDGLNQLIRENVSVAGTTPYTHVFVYDVGGNIQSKSSYTYVADNQTLGTLLSTETYVYGDSAWADKLTSYNGVAMTYDAIGNPLTWTDPNGAWTATWTMGRQLATLSKSGTSISCKYGADGIRTEKTVNGITTVYNVVGGVVTWEKTGTNPAIHYTYDSNGSLLSLEYNGSSWFYVRNAQNDVIGLVEASTGNWAAQYIYDAWGKSLAILDGNGNDVSGSATNIANVNPYRYRGYRFDNETGLYYLNSRYYNSIMERMLNADSQVNQDRGLTCLNLFAYDGNNPVNTADPSGHCFFLVTALVGAVVGAIVGGVIAAANGKNVLTGALIGGAVGGLIGLGAGAAAGVLLAGSATATTAAVLAGGSALTATIGGGGLVAGGKMIADNVSRAFNSGEGQAVVNKMSEIAAKGKAGEAMSGLVKNATRIQISPTQYRVPDGLDNVQKILSEVKNYSGTLSYTSQLRDFVSWSQLNGYTMHLYTKAALTGPLQEMVDNGVIQLFPLG
jgi:RHS repeat-associated protein